MTLDHTVEIAASASDLFSLTQDYTRRLDWDPFLRSAELLGGAVVPSVGVRAYCVAWNGMGMETEYVSYNPPKVTAVKMTRGPWLIDAFAGSWRFTETAPGRTRIEFRYSVHARPVWLSWLLTPLLAWVFARDTRKRLAALKKAVDSGKLLTNKSGPPQPNEMAERSC